MENQTIEEAIYCKLCSGCPSAKWCHDNVSVCDAYLNELERTGENDNAEIQDRNN